MTPTIQFTGTFNSFGGTTLQHDRRKVETNFARDGSHSYRGPFICNILSSVRIGIFFFYFILSHFIFHGFPREVEDNRGVVVDRWISIVFAS